MGVDPEELEARLGCRFRNRELLRRAVTHKSYVFEHPGPEPEPHADNEQLEFLGDAVLGFFVSEFLVNRYPSLPEGRLSRLKAYLVSSVHLHSVAQKLDLGAFLLLGRGEEMSGGRNKKALLANALEALIAALYLDAGPEQVRSFLLDHVIGDLDQLQFEAGPAIRDYKSALQEMAQSLRLPAPRYAVVGTSGPDHAKTFVVEARIGARWSARTSGPSKKSAGQKAAQQVLRQVMESTREA